MSNIVNLSNDNLINHYKIVAFGDSNINIFALMNSFFFKVFKIMGVSIKSILNKGQHYKDIIDILNRN